jgi:uncharacterized membrane protein
MSQLIVIGYPDSAAAERARDELFSLSRDPMGRWIATDALAE